VKQNFKNSLYIISLLSILFGVISCENEFEDLGSNIISNNKFDTNALLIDVQVKNSPVRSIQTDNISQQIGQYLLGVFNRPEYEKIEASIVSQVRMPIGVPKVVDNEYGSDTTVVTKIDTVFLKLPYQATLNNTNPDNPFYELDSVFGNTEASFNVNVYQSNTFINRYNPSDPSKTNTFFSDAEVEKIGNPLNDRLNYPFQVSQNDTILAIKRLLHDNTVYEIDTFKLNPSITVSASVPFARIPLNKERIKSLFLDKYGSTEFATQDEFNNYFRGLIIEATGDDGALVGFNFNNTTEILNPSIEVVYTNTVIVGGNTVVDTISKNDSFVLSGFRFNIFNEENRVYPENNEVKVQGTVGSEATITLFDRDKIEELRTNNWLINDASLTVYINQTSDTTVIPSRLTAYKSSGGATPILSQIKDAYSEAANRGIDGVLERDDNGLYEKYTFKITDYISDILNGETDYSPDLKIKVFNPTDLPFSQTDTIFRNYSWNPKAVTLFNEDPVNGDKKATLKISYSEIKN
jgi:hypothetical protein